MFIQSFGWSIQIWNDCNILEKIGNYIVNASTIVYTVLATINLCTAIVSLFTSYRY